MKIKPDSSMLNEVSQKEKGKYSVTSLICKILKNEITETENRVMIIRDWRKWEFRRCCP